MNVLEKMARAWASEKSKYVLDLNHRGPVAVIYLAASDQSASVFEGSHVECLEWVEQQCARAALRVALEDMKQPSEGMLAAAYAACDDYGQVMIKAGYRAMLSQYEAEAFPSGKEGGD